MFSVTRCFHPHQLAQDVNHESVLEFEKLCKGVSHSRCIFCRRVGIMLNVSSSGMCQFCSKKKVSSDYTPYSLPVWFDESGQVHYELPDELTGLRIGEQLMIQKLSLYVPIQYLRFGQLCCTGHVCAFPQDVQMLCIVLPRLPEQITRIRVIKRFSLAGDKEIGTKCFVIRREKVLSALRWLKRYNREYQDIVIDESNLDWLAGSDESELPVEGDSYDKSICLDDVVDDDSSVDKGPVSVGINGVGSPDNGECYGYFDKQNEVFPSSNQSYISNVIRTALDQGNIKNQVCFVVFCMIISFCHICFLF